MKKTILSMTAFVVLCVAAFTGYKVYENQNMSTQDTLLKQNLEALTWDENDDKDKEEEGFNIQSTEGYCYVWINGNMERGGGKPICEPGGNMPSCPTCYVGWTY